MTATNHLLAGAAIAMSIERPLLALPVALLSHVVMDASPHFGVPGGVTIRNKSKLFQSVLLFDTMFALAAAITLPILLVHEINTRHLLLTMAAALSLDFFWIVRFVREVYGAEETVGHWPTRLHRNIQKLERPWGIAIEIVVAIALIITIVKL